MNRRSTGWVSHTHSFFRKEEPQVRQDQQHSLEEFSCQILLFSCTHSIPNPAFHRSSQRTQPRTAVRTRGGFRSRLLLLLAVTVTQLSCGFLASPFAVRQHLRFEEGDLLKNLSRPTPLACPAESAAPPGLPARQSQSRRRVGSRSLRCLLGRAPTEVL